jgi:hypothetical protein
VADEPDPETTTAAPLSDDPSVVADRYRILRILGRGGGGTVWLARDENLGREVALKRVSGETDTDLLLTRGMREARTSAALAHDHVVRVYDAFEHEGAPWIVMEYISGPSLSDLIAGGQALPPRQVAVIGAQVATALAAAHGAGVVHRDVKPGNVLLSDASGEHAKLTDFGIARAEEDHQLTRTGMVSGTAAYFSPEVAQGEEPTAASDVWALGATLYTAVEGRRPFPDAPNAVAQLHTIVRQAPAEPRLAGPLTPVLAGMLHGDPAQRWTAERAATELRRIAEGDATTQGQAWGVGTPPGAAAVTGGVQGAAAWTASGTAGGATQIHRPVEATRAVPVGQEPAGGPVPRGDGQHARVAAGPPPRRAAPRRSGPRWGTVVVWLIAIPLVAALGWLVWTIAQGNDPDGTDDPGASTSAPAATGAVAPEEAGQLARTFYGTLLQGLEPARAYLGPDAAVDADIAEGLTRVEWDQVTTEPAADGSVAVGITVRYFYGSTMYEQREDLVVARPEGGGEPLIVSRSTSDPVITSPESGDGGDGSGDDAGESADQGRDG